MKHILKKFCIFIIILVVPLAYAFTSQKKSYNTDVVIFSFDRPLQLYALLESIEKYVDGIGSLYIIYRTSNAAFNEGYDQIKKIFPNIIYVQQGEVPYEDFKPLTLNAIFNSSSEFVMFAVDDDIVKDYVDLDECIELLAKHNAYAFYLWLGNHITECYPEGRTHTIPKHVEVEHGIIAWQFKDGACDWRYPHTVDLAIFRKKTIEPYFRNLNYRSPNTLEGLWAAHAGDVIATQKGLCFKTSKIVNLPLNRVQHDWANRHMNFMTPDEMLAIFNEGKKIDIAPLYRIHNKDPHMVYTPTFITR